MVRPPEASGNEDIVKLASDSRDIVLLGSGIPRILAQVPANRIGFIENGGPFNLMQLKIIQEVISLTVFTVLVTVMFKGQTLQWNHFAAFFCLIMAVFFVFLK